MTAEQGSTTVGVRERTAQRFGVAWRHPTRALIVPIGILDHDGERYRFTYVIGANTPGFRPLPGFPDVHRAYTAEFLFPFFEHRAMDARRPDYAAFLEALDLDLSATPLDVLARSGGRRLGDKLQMQREPDISADGTTACVFLVRGFRYVADGATEAIEALRRGDVLTLRADRTNPVNPDALQVVAPGGESLGWVPELLVDYVRAARAANDMALHVVRVNGSRLPAHLRLLVHLDGRVPPGYRPFSGPQWVPLTHAVQ